MPECPLTSKIQINPSKKQPIKRLWVCFLDDDESRVLLPV